MSDQNRVRHFACALIVSAFLFVVGCLMITGGRAGTLPLLKAGSPPGASETLSFVGTQNQLASCTICSFTNSGAHFTVVTGFGHVFIFGQGAGLTIVSATICGVAATLEKQVGVANTPGDWYAAAIVGGSTCDVVVIYSGATARNGISLYNSTGISGITPSSTGNNSACAAFPTPCATTAPTTKVSGGFSLAGGVSQNCTSNAWTVPATRDMFINIGAGAVCGSTASSSGNSAGTQTPSYTDSSGSAGGIAALEY